MEPGWWHCGVALQRAVMVIGIVDLFLGALSTAVLAYYIDEISHISTSKLQSPYGYHSTYFLPFEIAVGMLVMCLSQVIIGSLLFFGSVNRSKKACIIWISIAIPTSLFMWCLPIRLYMMFVVYMFYREVKEEQEVISLEDDPPQRPPDTPPAMSNRGPPSLISQYPPNDKFPPRRMLVQRVAPIESVEGDGGVGVEGNQQNSIQLKSEQLVDAEVGPMSQRDGALSEHEKMMEISHNIQNQLFPSELQPAPL